VPFQSRYTTLPDHFYREVEPTPLQRPFLVSWNGPLAQEMGVEGVLRAERAASHFGAMEPFGEGPKIATVYAGHQFGHYIPQLGDGRSILLGEWRNADGGHWDLHLKGSGPTPYSRMGDGRAVLRSTIREYLCGEAMHHLGIPTTRALCMVGSEEEVYRETIEFGATLLRTAPSHVRFGTFEYFYHRGEFGALRELLDYLVAHHFPALQRIPAAEQALELFRVVVISTAALVAQWQLVGFCHGVMNSDNMSILGITIDYGPYSFLDHYDPGFICNHSDHGGRYAFDQQPRIAQWNLRCLAQALLPLVGETPEQGVELLRSELNHFQQQYQQAFEEGMSAKLGLPFVKGDQSLQRDWIALLQRNRADYTRAFRLLSQGDHDLLVEELGDPQGVEAWLQRYRERLLQEGGSDSQRQRAMCRRNPKYILRNYLAQQAIELAERGDYSEIERLLELLRDPFAEQPEYEAYAAAAPQWAEQLAVSCSS
jgi:uncharacterized protein YdiU (UPF0061 family)